MRHTRRRALTTTMAVAVALALTTGCTIAQETIDGFAGSPPPTKDPATDLVVTVRFDSDAPELAYLHIDIDSPNAPAEREEDSATAPWVEEFRIPTTQPAPLRSVAATAEASPDAQAISCEILLDGKVVSSERSTGPSAHVECERRLRLGPS